MAQGKSNEWCRFLDVAEISCVSAHIIRGSVGYLIIIDTDQTEKGKKREDTIRGKMRKVLGIFGTKKKEMANERDKTSILRNMK